MTDEKAKAQAVLDKIVDMEWKRQAETISALAIDYARFGFACWDHDEDGNMVRVDPMDVPDDPRR